MIDCGKFINFITNYKKWQTLTMEWRQKTIETKQIFKLIIKEISIISQATSQIYKSNNLEIKYQICY